jgi:hypothetical protein
MVRQPGEPPSFAQIEKVPDLYRSWVMTFPDIDKMLQASRELGQAELCIIVAPGYIESGFNEEGNDEQWAKQQKLSPEHMEKVRNSVPVTINGHSARELAYREKAVMSIMEKYGGVLDPVFNNQKVNAQRFQYQVWSTGVPGLRPTGDFMVSIQGADGSPDMQAHYRPVEIDAFKPFIKDGALIQSSSGMLYRPMEHYALGCSGGVGTAFDPWDEKSLASARKYMDAVYDSNSPFRSFGYTNRGAMMQVEDIEHVHQRWGPIYDHADKWLMKVRNMLDPNRVCDWTGYIPPEYSSDRKE